MVAVAISVILLFPLLATPGATAEEVGHDNGCGYYDHGHDGQPDDGLFAESGWRAFIGEVWEGVLCLW